MTKAAERGTVHGNDKKNIDKASDHSIFGLEVESVMKHPNLYLNDESVLNTV